MIRGINKRRIVNDVADRKNFIKRLGELAAGTKTSIYTWALAQKSGYPALFVGY